MDKRFPASQFVLALASIATAMEGAMSPPLIFIWATVGIIFLSELIWTSNWWEKKDINVISKVTVFIAIALPVYTATYWNFIIPNVIFEIGNDDPFVQKAVDGSIWVRVRAVNRGWREVTCRFYLNRLEIYGRPEPILKDESLQLWPAGSEEDPSSDRMIPSNDFKYFNVVFIPAGAKEMDIPSRQFRRQTTEKLFPGIYKLTIQASHSNCRSRREEISVKYDGSDKVSIFRGTDGGRP